MADMQRRRKASRSALDRLLTWLCVFALIGMLAAANALGVILRGPA